MARRRSRRRVPELNAGIQSGQNPFYSSMIATARVHPADALLIFTGKHEIMKPCGGKASRLCSFSRWQ
jgi:hypothetical protein